MTDTVWYEEELTVQADVAERTAKSMAEQKGVSVAQIREEVQQKARGIVRIQTPRWGLLDPTKAKVLPSGSESRYYLVRLGFEFDIPKESQPYGVRWVYAHCEAQLRSAHVSEPPPRVYKVIPDNLTKGEPQQMTVKLGGPQVELTNLGKVTVGEVSTEFTVGTVQPDVVGFAGQDERAPYWEMTPNREALRGTRHLWLIAEVPEGASGFRLRAAANGEVKLHLGVFPVGQAQPTWDHLPSLLIQ